MANVTPVKFYCFTADLANKVHNLGSDDLRLVLTNTAPSLNNTVLSNITQIATGGGYTAGGFSLTVASSTQVNGNYKLIIDDYPFTATGAVADFRYAVVYNNTSATKALIFSMDYGAVVSGMSVGEQIIFDFDGTNGAITL